MDQVFSDIEIRVLGVLLEKETTTPDYYPLTLNSCVNACNQKSSRNPSMSLDDKTVARALLSLQDKHLLWKQTTADGRVPKYAHKIDEISDFSEPQLAVLCVLLLRGAQTLGEIRTRTNRLFIFNSTEEIENIIDELTEDDNGPFVVKLPRQPGRKDCRYTHLFGGKIELNEEELAFTPEPAVLEILAENKRIEKLEEDVENLKNELLQIKEDFSAFKEQFE